MPTWNLRRPEPSASLIKVAQPVSRRTWQELSGLSNFLRGKGAQLVPQCNIQREISSGSTETFRFRVKTRSTAVQRVWHVGCRAPSYSSARASIAGGPATLVYASYDRQQPIQYVETLGSKSSSEQEISITVAASVNTVLVENISCYEQDRPLLNQDSTDYGLDVNTCAAGQPIFDGTYVSAGGLYTTMDQLDARRVGIYHWSYGGGFWLHSSATPTSMLRNGVPVLLQKKYTNDTLVNARWSVYGYSTTAAGTITLTSTQSGESDAMTIPVGSAAWTTSQAITLSCDSTSSDDGLQSSTFDFLNFSLVSSGTNAVRVGAVSVWVDSF